MMLVLMTTLTVEHDATDVSDGGESVQGDDDAHDDDDEPPPPV